MTVEERIQFAKERQLPQLDISDSGLTEIPEAVFELTHLRTLILGKKYAPTEDTTNRNKINYLPIEMSQLKHLEGLGLSFNDFGEFPSVITNLPRLQTLMLNGNPLGVLSSEISKVRHLRILSLGNTGLIELPEEIGELRRLKILGLAHNQLQELPETFKHFQFLEQLGLANNQFGEIPEVIYRLTELHVLGLANNQIDSFPKELMQLKRLQRLDLQGNPLAPKVIQLAAKGNQAIQHFFFQKANQRQKLLKNIVEGKKEASDRKNIKDRFFRLLNSKNTICSVCDGEKKIKGYIAHLNMRFNNDKCFGCEGEGVATEETIEIHNLLELSNQKKERCRDAIILLVEDEQDFTKKIRAQRPNQQILFEETRRNIMEILQKKRRQIDVRVRQFSTYQLFEQKILIALYNLHLHKITQKERFEKDEFSLDAFHSPANLYGIAKSIEVILGEQEALFDSLMDEEDEDAIADIQDRLNDLVKELKSVK